jgi:DNA-binding helix-hairpin-helix protein with protein kinase domain
VYSAADVEYSRVRYVKGIGHKRATTLVAWRSECEATFRLDPHRGVDAGALAALRQRYVARHEALADALSAGPRTLLAAQQRVVKLAEVRRAALEGLVQHKIGLLRTP